MTSDRRADGDRPQLLYDGQCPVCSHYCTLLRTGPGELDLIDARTRPALLDEVQSLGLDIDEGVVLKIGDKLYAGAAAVNALAEFSDDASWLGRLNRWIFKSRFRADLLYPALRNGRGLLLKLLRRPKINEVGPGVE